MSSTKTSSAGYAAVTQDGVLAIGGRHRTRWLHGMITQNVKTMAPGSSRYACVVSVKGKVQQDFQLYNDADGEQLFLLLPRERVTDFVDGLKKFIVAEQVTFEDHSDQWTILTVQGDAAADLVGQPEQDLVQAEWGSANIRVVRNRRGLAPGFDLWVKNDDREAIVQILQEKGATPLSEAALESSRIQAAIPKFGVDFDDGVIPLEAGMMDAIHWDKGCYVGQEVLARLFYRGHTNKELRQLRMIADQTPAINAALFADETTEKSCGRITSVTRIEDGTEVLALGYVRKEFYEADTSVWVDMGGERACMKVTDRTIRSGFGE